MNEESKYGLCSHFILKCSHCDFSKGFVSSKKSEPAPDINIRLVYAMRQLGKGNSGASKLCATSNLPPRSRKSAFALQENKLSLAVSEVAHESMINAAEEVKTDETDECGVLSMEHGNVEDTLR